MAPASTAEPRVSVVIPAYEPGESLRAAIDSVLTQSIPDLELIVVDDGSREDLTWVGRHDDPRVTYLRQDNQGVSIARNVGATHARAPWLAFLDQDDLWHTDKLDRQLQAADTRPDASFHHTGFTWVSPTQALPSDPAPQPYLRLLSTGHVCLSSVLVSAEHYWSVGGHDPTLRIMQDYDLFLRLALAFGDPHLVPENLVDYRLHDQNASLDYASAARERLSILDRHAALAERRADQAVLAAISVGRRRSRELFGYQAVDAARRAYADGERGRVLAHLRQAVAFDRAVAGRAVADTVVRRVRGT